jgi:hypothetical protein
MIKTKSSPTITPKSTVTIHSSKTTKNQEMQRCAIKHPIYGLQYIILDVKDVEYEVAFKSMIFSFVKYVKRWCFVNNIRKSDMDAEDQRNCVISFIKSILSDHMSLKNDLNTKHPFFTNIIINEEIELNLNFIKLCEKILDEASGFLQQENSYDNN